MSKILLTLTAALCLPMFAQAGTLTDFVKVETGIFDDASMAATQSTWAMRVVADTDWTNSDMVISLSSGSMIHIPSTGFGGGPESNPQGLGDTAVFNPSPVGDITGGPGANTAVDHTESATEFSASWFNTDTDDTGTFDIAMVTISNDANGTLLFRTISGSDVEEGGFTIGSTPIFRVINGRIDVPEPTTLALAALGMIGLCGAARRRS